MSKAKRAIIAVILIAVLGCGAFIGYTVYTKAPKQAIIGTWKNDQYDDCCYVFNKDGTMSGKIVISPTLNMAADIEGIYVLDTEGKTLTITYKIKPSPLSIDLKKSYEFTKDGKLILADDNNNRDTYTKVGK